MGPAITKAQRKTYALQLIHLDIYGLMNVIAMHKALHFITFTDDYTSFGDVYLMTHKLVALSYFMKYKNLFENQLDMTINALGTDCGHGYLSNEFKDAKIKV